MDRRISIFLHGHFIKFINTSKTLKNRWVIFNSKIIFKYNTNEAIDSKF